MYVHLHTLALARDTYTAPYLHAPSIEAGIMEKITITLINRFQTDCHYHTSMTQSLPCSVNLKLKCPDIMLIGKNLGCGVNYLLVHAFNRVIKDFTVIWKIFM